jgi:uncharacterized protein
MEYPVSVLRGLPFLRRLVESRAALIVKHETAAFLAMLAAHPVMKRAFWLGLAGLCLLGCILASELLLLPFWLEPIGRVIYRAAFLTILPFRGVAALLVPVERHHWPTAHFVVACLGAPYAYWAAWRIASRLLGRLRFATWVRKHHRDHDCPHMSRRAFLARSTAGVVGVATGGLGSYASAVAPERLKVRRYEIALRDLPTGLDGLRIVHVSDTHYGPFISRSFLDEMVARANGLDADLVALTGDYVHFTPASIDTGIDILAGLRARFGAVAVLGNHDHWEGADACRAAFARARIPLLDNRRLFLTSRGLVGQAEDGCSLCVAGVGDLWEDEVRFGDVLGGLERAMPRVVLSHNPVAVESFDGAERLDLMLSGHTHGGQVRLPLVGAPVTTDPHERKYLGGLCYSDRCPVVVSRGVGLAGIPIRLRVPPEIGLVVLTRA